MRGCVSTYRLDFTVEMGNRNRLCVARNCKAQLRVARANYWRTLSKNYLIGLSPYYYCRSCMRSRGKNEKREKKRLEAASNSTFASLLPVDGFSRDDCFARPYYRAILEICSNSRTWTGEIISLR